KRRSKLGPREVENTRLREQIREQFTRSRQTYGSPRIACPGLPRKTQPHRTAHAQGATLRSATLQVSRPATTDSRHAGPIAPHRLRGLAVPRLDQVWATDAACVLTGQGWLYLVAVLDLFSRRVVDWAMSQLLDAPLAIAALRMALSLRRPTKSLIVHSDRGSQFASAAYRQLLTQHDLTASMARKRNCYDNAFIESFFSSLKYELVYHHRFATLSEARTAI